MEDLTYVVNIYFYEDDEQSINESKWMRNFQPSCVDHGQHNILNKTGFAKNIGFEFRWPS